MLKLMLDENISPSLTRRLWGVGYDTAAVRDRGMLRAADHVVWRACQEEGRAAVTINAGDFRRLAMQGEHAGLVIIPSGQGRDGQFQFVTNALDAVLAKNVILPSIKNTVVEVELSGAIKIESFEPMPVRAFQLKLVK